MHRFVSYSQPLCGAGSAKWGSENLSNLLRGTQLPRNQTRVCTRVYVVDLSAAHPSWHTFFAWLLLSWSSFFLPSHFLSCFFIGSSSCFQPLTIEASRSLVQNLLFSASTQSKWVVMTLIEIMSTGKSQVWSRRGRVDLDRWSLRYCWVTEEMASGRLNLSAWSSAAKSGLGIWMFATLCVQEDWRLCHE